MRKYLMAYQVLFFVLLFVPLSVFASVRINEIAWMGDSVSASREWIELSSDADVSLEGWSLSAVDGSPSISLSGSISGGYFLLERTSDESVPGVIADQIYTGALGNTGEILILKNANGVEVDRVDGSDGWSIGGDNSTKETLQRSNGVWSTGVGTPRSVNVGVTESIVEDTVVSSGAVVKGGFSGMSDLVVSVPKTMKVIAGSDTLFSAVVGDGNGTVFDSVILVWSFGDGVSLQGNKLYHMYQYPGTYIAVVSAKYGRQTAEGRIRVEVVNSPMSIFSVDAEKIVLENSGADDIDIARWRIVSGGDSFVFPKNTFIAGNSKVTFSARTFGFILNDVVLQYPNGEVASEYKSAEIVVAPRVEREVVQVISEVVEEEESAVATSALPASVALSSIDRKISPWIYSWLLFIVFVVGVVVFLRRKGY